DAGRPRRPAGAREIVDPGVEPGLLPGDVRVQRLLGPGEDLVDGTDGGEAARQAEVAPGVVDVVEPTGQVAALSPAESPDGLEDWVCSHRVLLGLRRHGFVQAEPVGVACSRKAAL